MPRRAALSGFIGEVAGGGKWEWDRKRIGAKNAQQKEPRIEVRGSI